VTRLLDAILDTPSGSGKSPRTFLPAALVATTLLAIVEWVGTDSSEGFDRFDSQWGASHLWLNPFSSELPAGVTSLLQVPVFDGASGLGYRLPNFETTNVGSFFILLSDWLPAHILSLMYMWLAVVLCWSTFDLVGRSWNGRNSPMLRLWFSALIALVVFSWLLENNWSIALAGMLGVVSTTVSLFHRGLYEKELPTNAGEAQAYSLLIGSVMLLAGSHPRYSLTLVPVLLWRISVLRNIGRLFRSNPTLFFISLAGLLYSLTVLSLELRSLKIPISDIPDPRQNNFDFLYQSGDFGDWRQFLRSLALNAGLPFLLMAKKFGLNDWFNVQYEFINFGVLFWLAIALWKARNQAPLSRDRRLALRSSSAALGTFLVWMTLTTESTSFPTIIRILFKADAYDLHFPATALVIVLVIIGAPGLGRNTLGSRKLVRLGRLSASTGVIAALCFPLVVIVYAPTLNGMPRWQDMSSGIFGGYTQNGPPPGRLAALLLPTQKCGSEADRYRAVVGISHSTVASRIGFPTVDADQSRFASPEAVVALVGCSLLTNTADDCNAEALDFLSLALIVERVAAVHCPWLESIPTLHEYFKNNDRSLVARSNSKYGNYYVSLNEFRRSSRRSCSIVENCLDNVTRTLVSLDAPPWQLCERDCWFRYVVAPERSNMRPWLLLPARFDQAVEVREVGHDDKLPVANFRGLLAVGIDSVKESTTLEVKINPDSRMIRLSLVPYASLATYIVVGMTLLRSSRSRQQSK